VILIVKNVKDKAKNAPNVLQNQIINYRKMTVVTVHRVILRRISRMDRVFVVSVPKAVPGVIKISAMIV